MKALKVVGLLALAFTSVVLSMYAYRELRPLPKATAGDAVRGERAFMDGDLGSANYGFMPRALFDALPDLFPELLPEGWASVGFVSRGEGRPPVGLVLGDVLGLPTYSTNCALCHAGLLLGKVVPGAPAFDFEVGAMFRVLATAVSSDALTVDRVAEHSAKRGRPLSIAQTAALRVWMAEARRRTESAPAPNFDLGPGRSNALNGWKRALGINHSAHVSWVDYPQIFNQSLKERTLYDGSITGDGAARIMLTELQKGRPFREPLIDRAVFDDLVAYMNERLVPPKFPFAIDAAAAEKGKALFEAGCSDCHGTYEPGRRSYPNRRIPYERVGTDPERALAMSAELKDAIERFDYRDFLQVDPVQAYMATALDGIWATAPFLHNGSVPTLWHLLQPESQRPVTFFRRWNAFDETRVGHACDEQRSDAGITCPPDAQQVTHSPKTLWLMDTRKPGNRNTGHTWGVELSDQEKRELIEYMKTL